MALLYAVLALATILSAQAVTDADILQFALNLEYLEANFYSCVVSGSPISKTLWGTGGVAPTGCQKALLGPDALKIATTIASDELAHVTYLRAALTAAGVTPVSQPALNIGTAFAVAANAAIGATLSPSFSPYGDETVFYHGAYIFEDVGVSAYLGAAPLISSKAYLTAAGGILSAEAYHAGSIRTLLYQIVDSYVFPYGASVGTIVGAISALRQKVGGIPDHGISVGGGFSLVPDNVDGLVQPRNTSDVLAIVYLGGSGKGGFFPNGLNGLIH